MGCPLKIIITSIITTALLSISLYLLINKISYKEQSSTVIPYSIEMLKNITFISDIIVLDSDQCPPNYKIQNLPVNQFSHISRKIVRFTNYSIWK